MEQRLTLSRPYVRIDRIKMQLLLRNRFIASGGITIPSKINAKLLSTNLYDQNIIHYKNYTSLTLESGQTIHCKLVIDATGPESKLIQHEDSYEIRNSHQKLTIGYQIAYGFIAHIDQLGPYDQKAMTLFDYRFVHSIHSNVFVDFIDFVDVL